MKREIECICSGRNVGKSMYQELLTRLDRQEQLNYNYKQIIENNEKYIKSLREDNRRLQEFLEKGEDNRVWFFQNDGYDHIGTMSSDLPVLITAHDLRHILLHGEKILEE